MDSSTPRFSSSASTHTTGHVQKLRAWRIAGAGTQQQSLAQDRGRRQSLGPPALTMKEAWHLRGRQMQESKVTSEVKVPGAPVVAPGACQTSSFNHLSDHRTR